MKKLQKQQAKKVKDSKNFQRAVKKVRKEYQKITNRKNDLANKLVAKFSKYETVVIQDEQLHNWHKSGHGKAVQHSVLGRVKAKLLQNPNTVVLGKLFQPQNFVQNADNGMMKSKFGIEFSNVTVELKWIEIFTQLKIWFGFIKIM